MLRAFLTAALMAAATALPAAAQAPSSPFVPRLYAKVSAKAITLHDASGLRVRELRVHWQRQRLVRGRFPLGERAGWVAQVREALLQMHRDGVIDFRSDALLLERGFQLIAPRHADHVLVEDVAVRHDLREHDLRRPRRGEGGAVGDRKPGGGEQPIVALGVALARGRPRIQLQQEVAGL